jgi:CheY-like chemotaxis protein
MKKDLNAIEVIGYGLAFLYAVALLTYTMLAHVPEFRIHAAILSMFGVLFLSALAVANMKEWGRWSIVFTNIMMGFLLLIPYYKLPRFEEILPTNYVPLVVFFTVIIVMYFAQEKMKRVFRVGKKACWQSVLLIDDDEVVLKTLRSILLSNGYAVLTARTGEHGLQIIRSQKPDLILLDVNLPGINGRELCRMIKQDEATKHIPVIFVTSKDSPEDVQAELAAGGIMHLNKPVKAKELLSAVDCCINSSS